MAQESGAPIMSSTEHGDGHRSGWVSGKLPGFHRVQVTDLPVCLLLLEHWGPSQELESLLREHIHPGQVKRNPSFLSRGLESSLISGSKA